jgi:hypothetical protein
MICNPVGNICYPEDHTPPPPQECLGEGQICHTTLVYDYPNSAKCDCWGGCAEGTDYCAYYEVKICRSTLDGYMCDDDGPSYGIGTHFTCLPYP